MYLSPFGVNGDDKEPWEDALRLGKIFSIFITILVIVWGLGAIVLAVRYK